MGIPGSANLLLAAGGVPTYEIDQSLRFDGSSYLNRTQSTNHESSDFTVSFWFKKSYNGPNNMMLLHLDDNTVYSYITFGESSGDDDQLIARGTSSGYGFNTSRKYRDPSAWYHLVLSMEAGVITKGWINGVLDSSSGATSGWRFNGAYGLAIGRQSNNSANFFNGYMAEFHFVDGSALTHEDFGEFDDNGVWRPIEVSGLTYGTNGYYLKFDPSATNGIGHDHSGNGNNFTANNFTTSGTGTDVMDDTPTTNWCTLNPLINTGRGTISNGNLEYVSGTDTAHGNAAGSFALPTSGKWYWEVTSGSSTNNESIGVANILNNPQLPAVGDEVGYRTDDYIYRSNGVKRSGGQLTSVAYGSTFTAGDIIGVMWDSDSGTIGFSKNGTDYGTAYSSITQVEGKFVPAASNAEVSSQITFNFGQRDFAYTPPTGYKALNTANLPAPDIADGSEYFNTVLYTGNGGTNAITGVGFQPDFIWFKNRSNTASHSLVNQVTDAYLASDLTDAESAATDLTYQSDGFTHTASSSRRNASSQTYVAWNWKADNTNGSSNTSGSITSTVSANPSAGFSIVTYTGTGSGATVGHGLGVAPAFIITKSRNNSFDWGVFHHNAGTPGYSALLLNTNISLQTNIAYWNDTAPTSTTFSIGSTGSTGGASNNYVAYCFAEVEGYSKFGSYTGNGSSDGPFVYTGHRVGWLMIKNVSANSEWSIIDAARDPYNRGENYLSASSAGAEASGFFRDNLSNGFKIRDNGSGVNTSGNTYIFMSFAEHPFGGDGVSPATAR